MMKVIISSPMKAFRKIKQKMLAALKPTWNIQATGFLAVAKSPEMPYRMGDDYSNWSEDRFCGGAYPVVVVI